MNNSENNKQEVLEEKVNIVLDYMSDNTLTSDSLITKLHNLDKSTYYIDDVLNMVGFYEDNGEEVFLFKYLRKIVKSNIINNILKSLPDDTEIHRKANIEFDGSNYKDYEIDGFELGAEYIIDKIKNF